MILTEKHGVDGMLAGEERLGIGNQLGQIVVSRSGVSLEAGRHSLGAMMLHHLLDVVALVKGDALVRWVVPELNVEQVGRLTLIFYFPFPL